jgi:hypothetical protein
MSGPKPLALHQSHAAVARALAQVWLRSDSGRRWRAALGCCLALLAVAGESSALESSTAPEAHVPSFSWELRALGGPARVDWTRSGGAVLDQSAAMLGLGVRGGGFLGSHVQVGASLSVSHYRRVGQLDARETEIFGSEYWLLETPYTVWSPIGAFVELYPLPNTGLFMGLSGSLGVTDTGVDPMLLAGYGIEVGYESSRSHPHGIGVFVRYGGWTGNNFFFTDSPDTLVSGELTLGVRWTFRP